MSSGRRRAAGRLRARTFTPHPGWRNFIEPGWRVVEDQREALQLVDELIDAEDWRTDKRTSWTKILHALVHHMDWTTGLITAVTLDRLGEAGARAGRTVSRALAWARGVGLLVVVEQGASAEFLHADHGRTPTYAMVSARPAPPNEAEKAQVTPPVDESGTLPHHQVDQKPLRGRGLTNSPRSWPFFAIPTSPAERSSATQSLIQRLGLDGAGVSGLPLWRLRALLKPWWEAGMSPAGVLHAMHHHPDRPAVHRGDALRDARSALAVLGHRLTPWSGRVGELPAAVAGQPSDYVERQRERLEHAVQAAHTSPEPAPAARERTPGQTAALASFAQHRARRRLQ